MKSLKVIASSVLIFSLLLSGYAAAETLVQVRLIDPLDEPEFYCLDLSGWGDHLKLDDPLQAFALEEDGRISITGSDLCIAAGNESTDASGPSHVWRVLSVQQCDAVAAELMTWQTGL